MGYPLRREHGGSGEHGDERNHGGTARLSRNETGTPRRLAAEDAEDAEKSGGKRKERKGRKEKVSGVAGEESLALFAPSRFTSSAFRRT
jgi:hypothetical protein